ncbi:hypothetical protein MBM_05715 [Drepanopeziza brunnea f. sp. 'multigermtubi' MB_m1]|uniref:Autophagy-related protein n=1 Tax=Marssonina brunnea f. sp. multigermtubi (strain MB_m1) TaxID=1072389 RepID=K1WTN7_MARBU|nr:uncharacterized protein MBM_05715 [Drepanopeziza brunnea f. sp. 'multigermtubi' MB_m1]EKD16421.1 hypothetical protein MBM_05715 [Drepanopeziza brunnea f. sp. 'multigermtubi' MB_m1]
MEQRLEQMVQDFARFFASAWTNKSAHTLEPPPELPPQPQTKLEDVRQELPRLFQSGYPMVLQHDDLAVNNIHVDDASGCITGKLIFHAHGGIFDWADAKVCPFGVSLANMKIVLGVQTRDKWHFHHNHRLLRELFWKTFYQETGPISDDDRRSIEVARLFGLFQKREVRCVVLWGSSRNLLCCDNGHACWTWLSSRLRNLRPLAAPGSHPRLLDLSTRLNSDSSPDQWLAAMAYVRATHVLYAAFFPRLARYQRHVRKAGEEDLNEGKINQAKLDKIDNNLERNYIKSISTAHLNIRYLLTLVIDLSLLLLTQGNAYANNCAPCLTSSSFFLLVDGFNTTESLIGIIQNNVFQFSFLEITYLGIAEAATSIISTLEFWYIKECFDIKTKHMFIVTNFSACSTRSIFLFPPETFYAYPDLVEYHRTECNSGEYQLFEQQLCGLFFSLHTVRSSRRSHHLVDIEKGSESCRQDVEDRKLIRLGEESSITTEQIVEGVALGELLPEGNGSGDNVEHIGVKFSGKKVD